MQKYYLLLTLFRIAARWHWLLVGTLKLPECYYTAFLGSLTIQEPEDRDSQTQPFKVTA